MPPSERGRAGVVPVETELDPLDFQPEVVRGAMAMVPHALSGMQTSESGFSRMLESSAQAPDTGAFSWETVGKTAENALEMLSGRSDQELVEALRKVEDLLMRLTGELGLKKGQAEHKPHILLFVIEFRKALLAYIQAKEHGRDAKKLEAVNQHLLELRRGIDSSLDERLTAQLVDEDPQFPGLLEEKRAIDQKLSLTKNASSLTKKSTPSDFWTGSDGVVVGKIEGRSNSDRSAMPSDLVGDQQYILEFEHAAKIRGLFRTYAELVGDDWEQLIKQAQTRVHRDKGIGEGDFGGYYVAIDLNGLMRKYEELNVGLEQQASVLGSRIKTKIEMKKQQLVSGS